MAEYLDDIHEALYHTREVLIDFAKQCVAAVHALVEEEPVVPEPPPVDEAFTDQISRIVYQQYDHASQVVHDQCAGVRNLLAKSELSGCDLFLNLCPVAITFAVLPLVVFAFVRVSSLFKVSKVEKQQPSEQRSDPQTPQPDRSGDSSAHQAPASPLPTRSETVPENTVHEEHDHVSAKIGPESPVEGDHPAESALYLAGPLDDARRAAREANTATTSARNAAREANLAASEAKIVIKKAQTAIRDATDAIDQAKRVAKDTKKIADETKDLVKETKDLLEKIKNETVDDETAKPAVPSSPPPSED